VTSIDPRHRLPIGHDYKPLNHLVSEIFSITVADTQTDTLTGSKGRWKLSSAWANRDSDMK